MSDVPLSCSLTSVQNASGKRKTDSAFLAVRSVRTIGAKGILDMMIVAPLEREREKSRVERPLSSKSTSV